jgi:hypothetical protein
MAQSSSNLTGLSGHVTLFPLFLTTLSMSLMMLMLSTHGLIGIITLTSNYTHTLFLHSICIISTHPSHQSLQAASSSSTTSSSLASSSTSTCLSNVLASSSLYHGTSYSSVSRSVSSCYCAPLNSDMAPCSTLSFQTIGMMQSQLVFFGTNNQHVGAYDVSSEGDLRHDGYGNYVEYECEHEDEEEGVDTHPLPFHSIMPTHPSHRSWYTSSSTSTSTSSSTPSPTSTCLSNTSASSRLRRGNSYPPVSRSVSSCYCTPLNSDMAPGSNLFFQTIGMMQSQLVLLGINNQHVGAKACKSERELRHDGYEGYDEYEYEHEDEEDGVDFD